MEFIDRIIEIDRSQPQLKIIDDISINFKNYYTNSKKLDRELGEVLTSFELVNSILDEIDSKFWESPYDIKGNVKKILEPSNGSGVFLWAIIVKFMNGLNSFIKDDELRYKFIIENIIYACEIQDDKMEIWKKIIDPNSEYKINTYLGSFLEDGFNITMENIWKVSKFSLVLSNPPYLKDLHLFFLNKSVDISEDVLFIHPSSWLFRNNDKNRDLIKKIKKIRLLNGNYYFDAEFGAPLSITFISKKESEFISLSYDTTGNTYNVKEIPSGFWEPSDIMLSLKSKYEKITSDSNLGNILGKKMSHKFIVTCPRICGHAVNRIDKNKFITKDFYTLFYKKSNLLDHNTKNNVLIVNSEIEMDNLIYYLKSKIARFGLMINKISQDSHIKKYLSNIPLPDLSVKYTDEDLISLYNITEEEWNFINKTIYLYYEDL